METSERGSIASFFDRYGHYLLGFTVPLVMLIMAAYMPERARELVSTSGLFFFLAWVWSVEYGSCRRRVLGLLVALVPFVASFAIPTEAQTLQSTSGLIAGLVLFFY